MYAVTPSGKCALRSISSQGQRTGLSVWCSITLVVTSTSTTYQDSVHAKFPFALQAALKGHLSHFSGRCSRTSSGSCGISICEPACPGCPPGFFGSSAHIVGTRFSEDQPPRLTLGDSWCLPLSEVFTAQPCVLPFLRPGECRPRRES